MSTSDSDLNLQPSTFSVRRSESTAVDADAPWLGLVSFTEETRAYFFGREEEVAELGRRVQRKLLTVLFGQSGLGKTSILRAGIVPRLRPDGYCPVYVRLDYSQDSPAPAEQIKQAIIHATRQAGDWTQTGVAQAGESLWEFLHHREDVLHNREGRPLIPLLIFDQFEEIFTLAQGDAFGRKRAAQFLEELADLVENRAPRALEARLEADEAGMERFDFARADYRLLIALREDYLAHLEGLKATMPSVTQNRMRLARMTGAQAIAAVVGPGRELVNQDVAQQIVTFVSGAADSAHAEVEPSLLSLVCRELNEKRRARGHAEITVDLLAGSRDTILTEFYERALADQPPRVRAFIEDELLTDSGYRESVAEERVKKGFAAGGAPAETLSVLIDRRLLRVEERLDLRRVELTHDVLCPVVAASRAHRQEREAKAAAELLVIATRAQEQAARQALWRARMIATACAIVALAAIGSAIFGFLSRRRAVVAERQAVAAAAEAVTARHLADAGRAQAEGVMDYMLTDLREELTNLGHAAILTEVSQKTVAYYRGLPPELMTAATQVAKANALANLGAVLNIRGDKAEANVRFEEAVAIFESIDRSGDMTPGTRIDYASALVKLGFSAMAETRFTDAIALYERAEQMLQVPLTNSDLHGRALRALAETLGRKAHSLNVIGRETEAAKYYQRAIVAADEGDRLPPLPRRPGLQAARMLPWYAGTLQRTGPAEAAAAIAEGRRRLERFLAEEPALAGAKQYLTMALAQLTLQQTAAWNFTAAEQTRNLNRAIFDDLLKVDPKNEILINNRAITYGSVRGYDSMLRRDFSGRESNVKLGMAGLSVAAEKSNFPKMNLVLSHGNLAALYGSMGRDEEAEQELARMQALANELPSEVRPDTASPEFDGQSQNLAERRESIRRTAEMARLNWTVVRASAEQALARTERQPGPGLGNESSTTTRRRAARDLMMATWAMGDYQAARTALATFERLREPLPEGAPINRRYDEVMAQLQEIHVLARAGELDEARKRLTALWPEVEAVFAAAPGEVFTQIEMAHALWVKVEIANDIDRPARQALLERALGYLRPWAEAGRLTRHDREVLLKGIEKQMETLRAAR